MYFNEQVNVLSHGKKSLILIFLMWFVSISRHAQEAMGKNKHHEW